MKKAIAMTSALLLTGAVMHAQTDAGVEAEVDAVKAVIETAYIQGIHNERDVDKIWSGFHPDFRMLVYRDGAMSQRTIQQWVEGIENSLQRNPNPPDVPVRPDFTVVQVSGNAAIAQIEVYRGERHLYSDFMSLYKFEDGWKIVNKIYYAHPR